MLAIALYRSGRQAEALRTLDELRRRLVDELGIDPSPALQQLYRSVIRQEQVLQPPSVQHPIEDHLGDVVGAFLAGRLVVIVGAGVNDPGERTENGLPDPASVASH